MLISEKIKDDIWGEVGGGGQSWVLHGSLKGHSLNADDVTRVIILDFTLQFGNTKCLISEQFNDDNWSERGGGGMGG